MPIRWVGHVVLLEAANWYAVSTKDMLRMLLPVQHGRNKTPAGPCQPVRIQVAQAGPQLCARLALHDRDQAASYNVLEKAREVHAEHRSEIQLGLLNRMQNACWARS